jgi:hypothetical protein
LLVHIPFRGEKKRQENERQYPSNLHH